MMSKRERLLNKMLWELSQKFRALEEAVDVAAQDKEVSARVAADNLGHELGRFKEFLNNLRGDSYV